MTDTGLSSYTSPSAGIWPDVEHLMPEVALRQIAAHSEASDRAGSMSEVGFKTLKQHKWPGLAVPEMFGGLGAGLLECCAVQRKLGAADPGLAIAATMHLGSVGVWSEHYRRSPDMTWVFMEAVAKQDLIVASAVAEPSLGGSVNRSTLRAKRVDGGWVVSGRKTPLSFAASADLITLQMQSAEGDDGTSDVLVALVPRDLPGVSSIATWNTQGMRGSGSDTLVLSDCMIPDPLVVYQGKPGVADDQDMVSGIIWFSLAITSTYLGLMDAALEETRRLLTATRIAHLGARRADLPSFQHVVGEQVAKMLVLESACAGLAMLTDAQKSPHALVAGALGLKQHALRVVPEVIGAFHEVCGGTSYARASSLERYSRDAGAIRFHPPTPLPVAQFLARTGLGLPAALDLDEASPRLQSAVEA